jgi:hypothetical protein
MLNQSLYGGAFRVVHSCCWKFLRNVHNLFTCALRLPSPAGLRLEISLETDKKKMNFIFNFSEKIFLTKKMTRTCPTERNKLCISRKFAAGRTADAFGVAARTDLAAQFCAASPS